MESLPKNRLFTYHSDTLSYIRKLLNVDKPEEMDRAIDNLEEWLKKQSHFSVKTFPRDFLERQIIFNKGSVELAKRQLDNLFTMKTISTSFHEKYNAKRDFGHIKDFYIQANLPKLTKDYYRVYTGKLLSNNFTTELLRQAYSLGCINFEYIRAYDYCNGFIVICDFRDISILELIAAMNLTDLKQFIGFTLHGYRMRVKGLHLITTSNTIDVFVKLLKQMVSKKMGQRIHIHKTEESLHQHIDKEILPKDFGGEEKSLASLTDDLIDELSTPEHIKYFTEMGKAVVEESLRIGDKIAIDDVLGISGSFRSICVD